MYCKGFYKSSLSIMSDFPYTLLNRNIFISIKMKQLKVKLLLTSIDFNQVAK